MLWGSVGAFSLGIVLWGFGGTCGASVGVWGVFAVAVGPVLGLAEALGGSAAGSTRGVSVGVRALGGRGSPTGTACGFKLWRTLVGLVSGARVRFSSKTEDFPEDFGKV